MKSIKIGIIMDPIESIKPYKDSCMAMMLAAQRKNWQLYYMQQQQLYIANGTAKALATAITVFDDNEHWFKFGASQDMELAEFDAVLMRKDPPFDSEYLYSCHLLALAEHQGSLVINSPSALCNQNEKLFIAQFPQLCSPTLVSRDTQLILSFLQEHQDIILKPLDGMGGASIFRVKQGDGNTNVILEAMSQGGINSIMAQKFIPNISAGDKRILMVNGEPVDYCLARIPAKGENRGNIAAGGTGVGQALSERDREIASTIGPVLRERGILFAGLDVIGDHLTEINITSPTCIRELDRQFDLDIAGDLMDVIEAKLKADKQAK